MIKAVLLETVVSSTQMCGLLANTVLHMKSDDWKIQWTDQLDLYLISEWFW